MIWTTAFWKGAAERAVKTFAQTLVAVIGVGAVGLLDVDWIGAISAAALATLASLLTSIGNAEFTAGSPVAASVTLLADPALVSPPVGDTPAEVSEWAAAADPGSVVTEPEYSPLDRTHGETLPERAADED